MAEQTTEILDVRDTQASQDDWATISAWNDPAALWDHLRHNTNIVRAAELLEWPALLPADATVLDLGCGAGWLAARLSTEPAVKRVLAWDSSPALLRDLVPEMIGLVGGDGGKIERVCGDFLPLLLDNGTVDLVVMSSAFHHAQQPEALLAELARVLAPSGVLILLNETPWHPLAILSFATRMYGATLAGLMGRVSRRPGHLGSRHLLYDDKLGDRAYSLRAWRQIVTEGGWTMEVRDTGLVSYPESYRPRGRFEPRLVHFILRPPAGTTGNASPGPN